MVSHQIVCEYALKSIFSIRGRYYVCFIYVPPVNSTFTNSQENNSFEMLENDVCKFKSKGRVVLMGDLNSRTGTSPDFNVTDDDKWALTQKNLSSGGCEQHRRRPACASTQTDQRLCYSIIKKNHI